MSSEDPSQISVATGGSFPEMDSRRSFLKGLPGLRIADRYEVARILGEGGMGVVVEARHLELEQQVAIKFMFPEFMGHEVLSARFSREAKIAARVQSPHIVRVTDVGRLPSGVPYLVMDLLAGHDLQAELQEHGVLPVERAVDYVLQACAGIAALHQIGVVHRDLKPSNLFIADIAGAPTVKVLDFGISKDVTTPAGSITSTDTQLGTPMYMSPEQIRASKNVDSRSDLWSLGVILYELLTGTLPFERSGHSVGELFAVILMTDPMPLCMRRPELPPALEEVVMRCLRRNSWERHENVAELAEALRPFAREKSLHRVEAVRRALGDAGPSSDLVAARAAAASLPTVSAPMPSPAVVQPALPVAITTPARKPAAALAALEAGAPDIRLEVDYGPSPPRSRVRPPSEPETPSLVPASEGRGSSVSTLEHDSAASRAGLVWGLGIAAAIVGATATFAVRAASTPAPAQDPSPDPLPTVAEPRPQDTSLVGAVPSTAEPPPVASPRATTAPRPASAPAPASRPVMPRPASPPPPTATASARPRVEDLIQDRK